MSSSSRSSRSGGGGRVTAAGCPHNHRMSSPPSPYYSYYYYNTSLPSASSFACTTSSFGSSSRSTSSSTFHHHHSNSFSSPPHHHYGHSYTRSTSPTRVNFVGSVASTPSVRFSLVPRSISPGRSFTGVHHHHNHQHHHHTHQHHQSSHNNHPAPQQQRRTCMCSPTTHPGSFRCALHKNIGYQSGGHNHLLLQQHSLSAPSNRLNARRSAMTNSLVRIGTVEGDLVKRALAALIRPSSHQQRRRASFQLRPSRLSIMSCAGDDDGEV